MPKEFVHYIIAKNVLLKLREDPFWKDICNFETELYLGSIFPDALYSATGTVDASILRFPDALHGANAEDSLDIIKKNIPPLSVGQSGLQKAAFLVGVISHIFADATFHPLVYYFTGNYYDADEMKRLRAMRAHRRFECVLDIWFAGGIRQLKAYQLYRLLDNVPNFPDILDFMAAGAFPTDGAAFSKIFLKCYQNYCLLRKLYTSAFFQRLIVPFDTVLPLRLSGLTAVAYNTRDVKYAKRLDGDLAFRIPMTGEQQKSSLEELAVRATADAVNCCGLLKDFLLKRNMDFMNSVGPSLETGIPNTHAGKMMCFAQTDFFR